MATQIIEFTAGDGETLTVLACAAGADSPIKTANGVAAVTDHPGLYRATFTDQALATGLWRFWALSGAELVGRGMVSITAASGTFRETIEVTADVDENAIADAVYDRIQGSGTTVALTGPVLTNGGPLTIVIGDDYLNETVDRRISVTLDGTGYGSLTTDTWQLRLNTRGAEALEITGTAATISADSLQVKFPVTATQSGGLIATQGEWSVRRTPVTTTAEFDVIRGPLIASRDLSVKRT